MIAYLAYNGRYLHILFMLGSSSEVMMSLEDALAKSINEILQYRLLSPYPIFADKQDMAKILGISTRTLDRLVLAQKLIEEKHFTRFVEGGQKMFVVKLVVAELKPLLANVDEMF